MNIRLQALFAQAGSLREDRQDDLADFMESFMGMDDPLLTAEEMEELRRIEAKPAVGCVFSAPSPIIHRHIVGQTDGALKAHPTPPHGALKAHPTAPKVLFPPLDPPPP